jgi:hypothetical protein
MNESEFDNLSTHDKLKALNRDQLAILEQVRKVAEKLDRHLRAEARANAAYAATFNSNTKEEK